MSLREELENLSPTALTTTFDREIDQDTLPDEVFNIEMLERWDSAYPALMGLVGYISEMYKRDPEVTPDEATGFNRGAMAVVATLLKHVDTTSDSK
jgi:hypothetical protein